MMRPDASVGPIYLYRHPVDMRKAANGLVAIVESEIVDSDTLTGIVDLDTLAGIVDLDTLAGILRTI